MNVVGGGGGRPECTAQDNTPGDSDAARRRVPDRQEATCTAGTVAHGMGETVGNAQKETQTRTARR